MSEWVSAGKVRMTPKGPYSFSTAYEILDLVSNSDKSAFYIAKKNVPAGTALTNEDYWECILENINDEELENIMFDAYPICESHGEYAVIDNTINAPLRNFKIYGKCVQNGIPSVSNPVEISILGNSGSIGINTTSKNLVPFPYGENSVTADGVTFTAQADGSVKVQGTATGDNATYIMVGEERTKNALIVGQRYKVTTYNGGNANYGPWNDCWFQVYSADSQSIIDPDKGYSEFTWHGVGTGNTCNMAIRVANGKTVDTVVYPMVRFASVGDSSYVSPYSIVSNFSTPNIISGVQVLNGGNYIDLNGQQWICDTIDKNTKVHTKRTRVLSHVSDTGIEGGAYVSGGNTDYTQGYITFAYAVKYLGELSVNANSELPSICSHLIYDDDLFINHTPGTFVVNTSAAGLERIYVCLSSSSYVNLADDAARVSAFVSWWENNSVIAVLPYYRFNGYSEPYDVINLNDNQIAVLDSLAGLDGNTVMYIQDNVLPDIYVEAAIDTKKARGVIKEYYVNEMDNTLSKVLNVNNEPSLVFPWVTDIHLFASPVQTFDDMIKNISYLNKQIKCDFVLNTGDTIEGNQLQEYSLQYAHNVAKAFKSINEPYYFANGNHDNNPYINSGLLTFDLNQTFSAYLSMVKGAIFNMSENGTDYYIDYDNIGVRFIVLNSCNTSIANNYGFGNTTAVWLEEVLNTNSTVILASHVSPVKEHTWNATEPGNVLSVKTKLSNFVSNGGKLIVLSGHSHVDAEFVSPFIEITNTCQKFEKADVTTSGYQTMSGQINGLRNPDRLKDTFTADSWSVVIYKPVSNEIDTIRFGAGVDRYIHCTAIGAGSVTTRFTGNVSWHTSDNAVATVSNGVISKVGTGKCAIFAKDIDGNIEVWIAEMN